MKTLQLTLNQWVIVSLIAIVGILVVILKLQGSKLHKLKLELMKKELEILTEKDAKNVKEKKKALKKAKKELESK